MSLTIAMINQAVETAAKMKKAMLKKGLRRARAVCPACSGMLRASIAGRRNHLHMACDNAGCHIRMME